MTQLETKKIGELLCEKSYLDAAHLEHALAEQQHQKLCLGQILLNLGYVTQIQLTEALAVQAGIERIDPTEASVDPQVVGIVPAELVSKYSVMPLWQKNGQIAVAMSDPFDAQAVEDLRVVTGSSIQRYFGHPMQMEQAIIKFYGSNVARMLEDLAPSEPQEAGEYTNGDYSPAKLHELAREPSLINLVNLVLMNLITNLK